MGENTRFINQWKSYITIEKSAKSMNRCFKKEIKIALPFKHTEKMLNHFISKQKIKMRQYFLKLAQFTKTQPSWHLMRGQILFNLTAFSWHQVCTQQLVEWKGKRKVGSGGNHRERTAKRHFWSRMKNWKHVHNKASSPVCSFLSSQKQGMIRERKSRRRKWNTLINT